MTHQHDVFLAHCRGEEVGVAPVFQAQPLSQGVGADREVACRHVGLAYALQRLSQVFLVHGAGVVYLESAAREVGPVLPAYKEM